MPFPQGYLEIVTRLGDPTADDSADAFKISPVGSSGGRIDVANVSLASSTAITSSGTTTVASATVNPGARGAMFQMNVSSQSASAGASPTLDVKVQGHLPQDTTSWFDLPDADFNQVGTSTGDQVLILYPGSAADSGSAYRRTSTPLTPTFRLRATANTMDSGSTGATYELTLGAVYIP